jgi:hypothetical protein
MKRAAGVIAALVSLAACGDDPVTAYFAVPGSSTGDDFYALPFPNDLRRHPDGKLDLSEFPTNSIIVDTVRQIAERDLDGFGLNAALFARFSGALDPATLPSPAASMTADASVYVVDIDPNSPTYGERSPVVVTFRPEGTLTILGNRLVVRPYPGFPLADATTYALVITNRVGAASGGDVEADADWSALRTSGGNAAITAARTVYQPLFDWLDEPGGDEADEVVSAAVFTTQHAVRIMPSIRKAVYSVAAPVARDVLNPSNNPVFSVWTGAYDAPNLQTGTPAYITTGGEIQTDANGDVKVQLSEPMRFALSVPAGPVPATGFPICIYQHGTTGDWRSFIQDGTADRLAQEGIAVISTDQVLHGPRGASVDPSVAFFNFNNPVAARDNPLQGAADAWSQMRLALGLAIDDTAGSRTITFDTDRVLFYGHSQGGLTGPGFVAFEPLVKGAVLSGTGGVFYLNVLDKIEPVNFPELITTLIRDEPVDEDNPTLALAQMSVERNDPVNYAQLMVRRLQVAPDGTTTLAPRNIFQIEGFVDMYSPNRGLEAFATALGADIAMNPDAKDIEGITLRGRSKVPLPIVDNYGTATAVLAQFNQAAGSDGHFVGFDIALARTQARKFLGTLAATGHATVVAQ